MQLRYSLSAHWRKFNLEKVSEFIKESLPIHPPYFPKDQLTDKPERFFASEMIREKNLHQLQEGGARIVQK